MCVLFFFFFLLRHADRDVFPTRCSLGRSSFVHSVYSLHILPATSSSFSHCLSSRLSASRSVFTDTLYYLFVPLSVLMPVLILVSLWLLVLLWCFLQSRVFVLFSDFFSVCSFYSFSSFFLLHKVCFWFTIFSPRHFGSSYQGLQSKSLGSLLCCLSISSSEGKDLSRKRRQGRQTERSAKCEFLRSDCLSICVCVTFASRHGIRFSLYCFLFGVFWEEGSSIQRRESAHKFPKDENVILWCSHLPSSRVLVYAFQISFLLPLSFTTSSNTKTLGSLPGKDVACHERPFSFARTEKDVWYGVYAWMLKVRGAKKSYDSLSYAVLLSVYLWHMWWKLVWERFFHQKSVPRKKQVRETSFFHFYVWTFTFCLFEHSVLNYSAPSLSTLLRVTVTGCREWESEFWAGDSLLRLLFLHNPSSHSDDVREQAFLASWEQNFTWRQIRRERENFFLSSSCSIRHLI